MTPARQVSLYSVIIAFIFLVFVLVPGMQFGVKDWDQNKTTTIGMGLNNPKWVEKEAFTNLQLQSYNTLGNCIHATIEDNGNGLVYNILLFLSIKILGPGYDATRLISVAACFFSILVFSLLAFRIFKNPYWACLAVLLFACHGLVLLWAEKTRTYSLALLFVISAAYFLYRIINEQRFSRSATWGFIIFSTLAFLTHYYTVLILVNSFFIMVIFMGVSNWRKILLTFFVIGVLAGIWFALGGYIGWQIMQQASAHHIQNVQHATWYEPLNRSTFIKNTIQLYLQLTGNWAHWELLDHGVKARYIYAFAFIPLLLILFYALVSYIREPRLKQPATYLVLLSLLPFYNILIALKAGHTISLFSKYSIFSLPFLILMLVGGFWQIFNTGQNGRGIIFKVAGVIISVAFLSFFILGLFFAPKQGFPADQDPYIHAAKVIEQQYATGDTLIFPDWSDAAYTNIYLGHDHTIWQYYSYAVRDSESIYIKRQNGEPQLLYHFMSKKVRADWN